MLTAEQIEEFTVKGFLKGEVVLTNEEIDRLNHALDRVLAHQSEQEPVLARNLLQASSEFNYAVESANPNDETVIQVVNIWMASQAFFAHMQNRRICEEVAQLTKSRTLRVWHDQIQYKPPKIGGPTYWHQDHPAWPVLQPADLVSAWVALDDAVIENGCMWMVPESHRWGNVGNYLKTDLETFKPYLTDPTVVPEGTELTPVPFEIKKGQVGYHHCLMWHGAYPNRSERKRRAIAVHYMPEHVRYVPTGGHVMESFIHVAPGEVLTGDAFPVVYSI